MNLLGIFAKNCIHWGITEQACNAFNFVVVPVYETLGMDSVEYIMQQTHMKTCICGTDEAVKLLESCSKVRSLKYIVQIGEISPEMKQRAEECNLTIIPFDEIEAEGEEHPLPIQPPCGDDVCTICYTSGTTGQPKGVVITHRNYISSIMATISTGLFPESTDRYLSYLPLAHVLERVLNYAILSAGGRIGYSQGSTRKIVDDLKALRPTIFCSVPQLLNRVCSTIKAEIEKKGVLVNTLFHWGMASKQYRVTHRLNKHHWFFDPLLFNAIRRSAGLDCVRITVCGSAPLSNEVKCFLRCMLNGIVVEGYGATETCGPTTIEYADDTSVGTVGGSIPCCFVKLVDVPEMGYYATDRVHEESLCLGRGELCIRGYNIFSDYYKNPNATKNAFDEDGFFKTGDIAVLLPNYAIKIIGRRKDYFKLSQGEYISAEKLEELYSATPFVKQMFIHGDSLRSYLVAFIVPEKDYVMNWAKSVPSLKNKSFSEICKSEILHDQITNELSRIYKEQKLKGFERIVKFFIDSEGWSVTDNLVTPTFKLKRHNIKDKYENQINEMYCS